MTFKELFELWKKQPGHENDIEDEVDIVDVYEKLLWSNFDQSVIDHDDNLVYCGISPAKMKDDETLAQFKERVVKTLEKNGIERTINEIKLYGGIDNGENVIFDIY